jgi:hypothetical protein
MKNTEMKPTRITAAFIAFVLPSLLSGCTSSGVIPAGPNTYMISAGGAGFSTGGVRASTYRKAHKFCEERGLVFVPISFDAQPGVLGQRPPTADLVFRALPPGDPEIQRPNLEQPHHIQRVQIR